MRQLPLLADRDEVEARQRSAKEFWGELKMFSSIFFFQIFFPEKEYCNYRNSQDYQERN